MSLVRQTLTARGGQRFYNERNGTREEDESDDNRKSPLLVSAHLLTILRNSSRYELRINRIWKQVRGWEFLQQTSTPPL